MGSGTSALAAMNTGRNSVGYEINDSFRLFYNEKVVSQGEVHRATFIFQKDKEPFDLAEAINQLPYHYKDPHRLDDSLSDIDYGAKRTFCEDVKMELKEIAQKQKAIDMGATVMVNHARPDLRKKMTEKGICYLRAGDSKGSLLVKPGFERLQYVLLHTNGEHCQLFKLKSKGRFQIWTKETLEKYGFEPSHAPYYIILLFDNTRQIEVKNKSNLKQCNNTFVAKIRPLSDFISI